MTRYWLTTHWPPFQDEINPEITGVYLPDDNRREVGMALNTRDLIMIYQSVSGPTRLYRNKDGTERGRVPSIRGRGGIVVVVKATSRIERNPDVELTEYTNRNPILWAWEATTEPIDDNGFVPRIDVNRILGYRLNYNLHGFGTRHSGLKEITELQFQQLYALFQRN